MGNLVNIVENYGIKENRMVNKKKSEKILKIRKISQTTKKTLQNKKKIVFKPETSQSQQILSKSNILK